MGDDKRNTSARSTPIAIAEASAATSRPRKALRSVRFRRQSCADAVLDNSRLIRKVPVDFFAQNGAIRTLDQISGKTGLRPDPGHMPRAKAG